MKIISSSYEILEQKPGIEGIYEQIELAGRTCYKSARPEGKTAKDFVDRMVASQHYAMLEHGTVYLKIPYNLTHRLAHPGLCRKYLNNPYTKVEEFYELLDVPASLKDNIFNMIPYIAVTTNYRVIVENGWLGDLKYLCEPTQYHPKRVTVKFICDRGVSHEFVRHRVFSFAQESTRYRTIAA